MKEKVRKKEKSENENPKENNFPFVRSRVPGFFS
jgi:hypothetical protein